MIQRGLLLLAFAAAAMPLAAGIELGPPMTFADLRPGPPGGFWLNDVWAENGEVVTIIDHRPQNHWAPIRMTIRRDGTADPKAFVPLPIPRHTFRVTPFRAGMIAVWSVNKTFTAILDRNGRLIEGPKSIPMEIHRVDFGVVCNDTRCLAYDSGEYPVLIDEHGSPLKTLDRNVAAAVAGPAGFLLNTTVGYLPTDPQINLLDNDGTMRTVQPGSFVSGVFDGERYAVLTGSGAAGPFLLSAIDPSTGASSTPVHAVGKFPGPFTRVSPTLVWNGSMYLITMRIILGFGSFPPMNCCSVPWFATMRVARSFAPIDKKPRLQVRGYAIAVGVPDGFRILQYYDGSIDIIRTAMLSTNGQVVPPLKAARPVLIDHVWQYSATAAASRSTILGIYTEDDGEHRRLLAARIARDGTHLDTAPLTLATDAPYGPVAAASDGDGFLVVWSDGAKLLGATIDAAGNAQTFAIDDDRAFAWKHVFIDFAGGFYQVAAISEGAVDAITIASTGAIVQRERVDLRTAESTSAIFDGRRLLMLESGVNVWSTTKDVPGGALTRRKLLSAVPPAEYELNALRRDGDGALAFLTYYNLNYSSGTRDWRWITRINRDGDITTAPVLLSGGLFAFGLGIVRIDGALYATFTDDVYDEENGNQDFLVVNPLDETTLRGGTPLRFGSEAYRGHLVAGWNGEGLLFYYAAAPTATGITSQMAVRIVHAGK